MNKYTRNIYFKDKLVEETGPSVDSNDLKQRITARRNRIALRVEERNRGDKVEEEEPRETTLVEKQLEASTNRIRRLQDDSNKVLSNISVVCDGRENLRRAEESKLNEVRCRKLGYDTSDGHDNFNKLIERWETVRAVTLPMETRELLQEQKQACGEFVAEKNRLINELNFEVKAKDDHYVRELRKRSEDVKLLAERMDIQVELVRKAYNEELDAIEQALVQQREQLKTEQQNEWSALLEEIKKKQIKFLDNHEVNKEEYDRQANTLRAKHSEAYNALKFALGTEVQSLQSDLFKLKATYQLNMEKLEYNFQVLKRRDEENMVTKSNQKRKITRLQSQLNDMRVRAGKKEHSYKADNQQLSDDYKRRMEKFKELQKKSKLLIETEQRHFDNIWAMNEEELQGLSEELIEADRVIHEQQLGLPWDAPVLPFLNNKGPIKQTACSPVYRPTTVWAMQMADNSRHTNTSMGTEPPTSLEEASPAIVRQFLELICYEPEFLLVQKNKMLLKALNKDDELLMRLDLVLTLLGINSPERLNTLFCYFIKRPEDRAAAATPPRAGQEKQRKTAQPADNADDGTKDNKLDPKDPQDPTSRPLTDSTTLDEQDPPLTYMSESASPESLLLSPELLKTESVDDKMPSYQQSVDDEAPDAIEESGADYSFHDRGFVDILTKSGSNSSSGFTRKTKKTLKMAHLKSHGWRLIDKIDVASVLHRFTKQDGQFDWQAQSSSLMPASWQNNQHQASFDQVSDGSEVNLKAPLGDESSASVSFSEGLGPERGLEGTKTTSSSPNKTTETDDRDDSRDAEYWDSFATKVITPEKEQLWDNLYRAQQRYLTLLRHRAKLLDRNVGLKRQNKELRELLQIYMDSQAKAGLQFMPNPNDIN